MKNHLCRMTTGQPSPDIFNVLTFVYFWQTKSAALVNGRTFVSYVRGCATRPVGSRPLALLHGGPRRCVRLGDAYHVISGPFPDCIAPNRCRAGQAWSGPFEGWTGTGCPDPIRGIRRTELDCGRRSPARSTVAGPDRRAVSPFRQPAVIPFVAVVQALLDPAIGCDLTAPQRRTVLRPADESGFHPAQRPCGFGARCHAGSDQDIAPDTVDLRKRCADQILMDSRVVPMLGARQFLGGSRRSRRAGRVT